MSSALPPSGRKVRISSMEASSFPNSGQLVLDMTDKSAYTDFANTPYTPHIPILREHEAPLHETNRSQLQVREETREKLPFVTQSPHFRECLAEFLGAVIVIGIGLGVNSQVIISQGEAGDTMTISLAWGVAVLMGVYTAERVSGAHLISVITFTNAVYGRIAWWKVPGYICAQTLGAFVAAALVYLLHYEKIAAADPNKETMQKLFVTFPHGVSNYTAFYTEVLVCAFLMSAVYAITDQRNRSPGPVGTPFALALLVMAVGAAFGMNTGLGVSLNRDFGPRVFMYIAGFSSVFTEYSYYFWIPVVAPFVGGVIGAGAYTLFVEIQHPKSA
ncbi:hypothetical protein BBJ28_00017487 [Nothophytophthora sp. Chile5]|nr:hypothetical protein BBJ28_00017487 [Nothophytophthora sp. Chile5]